jgi:Peptidase A4 family
MSRRFARIGAIAAVVSCSALAMGGAASAAKNRARHASSGLGVLIPAHKGEKLPLHGGTADSLNWSGYAVTPGSGVTAVKSTFTVPVAGLDPPGFAATWAGIGGYNTSDLIQAGVEEQSAPSNSILGDQYQAWYELLPASETPISNCSGDSSCTVTPGDQVTVDISNVSGDTWSISLTDAGKWSWSQDVTYSSSESSAEWILEAPTLVAQTVLANVGTVPFGSTSTYTQGGTTHTIASGSPTQIDLGTGVANEATPSALASDGQSFNDCSYALSCPTP